MEDVRTKIAIAEAALKKEHYQEAEELSRKLLLQEEYSSVEKAEILTILCMSLWQHGFAQDALPFAQEALEIFQAHDDKSHVAKILGSIGNIYRLLYDNTRALEYCTESLHLYQEISHAEGTAVGYSNIGLIYTTLGDFQKALESYLQALKIFEEVDNPIQQTKTLSNIGGVYKNLSNFPLSLEYLLKALHLAEVYELHQVKGTCLVNISSIYTSLADVPLALEYAHKALQHYEKNTDPVRLAICLHTLGSLYIHLSESTRALEYQMQSLEQFKKAGHKEGIMAVLNSIANIYLTQSLYNEALPYYSEALQIAQQIQKPYAIISILGNLGIVYHQTGDYTNSFQSYEQALQLSHSIHNEEKTASILVNLSELYANSNSHVYSLEKAEELNLQGIELCRKLGLKNVEADALKILSPIYRSQQRWQEADETFQQFYALEKEILSNERKKLADGYAYNRQIAVMEKEREVTDMLLHKFLPAPIIPLVKEKSGKLVVQHYESISVMFADVVGFTKLSMQVSPSIMIELLDSIFTSFDTVIKQVGGHRLRTMGDGYFAICGAPDILPDHQIQLAKAALQMQKSLVIPVAVQKFIPNNTNLRVRIGLHCGPAVCGLVGGLEKWQYDAYGDTINTASRMESHGEAGEIHCTEDFRNAVIASYLFTFVPRPAMEIKSKGIMQTYFLKENIL